MDWKLFLEVHNVVTGMKLFTGCKLESSTTKKISGAGSASEERYFGM